MSTFYYIGILNQEDKLVSVFNGAEYVTDTEDIKLYPKYRKTNALQEAGRHQSLNCPIGYEVRLFPVEIETPVIESAEAKEPLQEASKVATTVISK